MCELLIALGLTGVFYVLRGWHAEAKRMPARRVAILHALKDGPLSGYQAGRRADELMGEDLGGMTFGTPYRLLDGLRNNGLVWREILPGDRTRYGLTPAGEQEATKAMTTNVRQTAAHLHDPLEWLADHDAKVERDTQPQPYVVEFESGALVKKLLIKAEKRDKIDPEHPQDSYDMDEVWDRYGARSLEDARLIVEALRAAPRVADVPFYGSLPYANGIAVTHRTNIRDETPSGDPRGLIWDWDEEAVPGDWE